MTIAPSILNSNILEIKKNIDILENNKIDRLHIDLMDGVFVKDMAFGPKAIKDIRDYSKLILDVHLMIDKPEIKIEHFLETGADILTFHIESSIHAMDVIQKIKEQNIKAGIAINPATPVENIISVLPYIDQVTVMTTNPGTFNQTFIPEMIDKIKKLDDKKQQYGYEYDIEVDGKITDTNIEKCHKAGANIFVSGGYIFDSPDIQSQIKKLNEVIGIE